jgi:uncharacterized protein (DUF2336 family)
MPSAERKHQGSDLQDQTPSGDEDLRPALLNTLAELFVSQIQHSLDEIRQFEAAVEGLMIHSRPDVRLSAAEKLADYPHTPRGVVNAFLAAGDDVATPFLKRSVCMPQDMLERMAKEGDSAAACCIASRVDLANTLITILVGRQEIEVLRALGRNMMAPLSREHFEELVRQARFDRPLARSLCMRARDPLSIAPLFLFANTAQRDAMILAERRASLGEPLSEPISEVELNIAEELVDAADARDLDEASWLVARAIGCTTVIARDIIADASGEPLALVMAQLRIDPENGSRILAMFDAPPLRSPERVKALYNILRDTPRACADRLLKEMVGLSVRQRHMVHAPVSDLAAAQTPSRPAQMGTATQVPESPEAERKLFLIR